MTDQELIDHVQSKCTKAILDIYITYHCWLEDKTKDTRQEPETWGLMFKIDQIERILELARKGLK